MAFLMGLLLLGACSTGNEVDQMERAVDDTVTGLDQALAADDEAERQELIAQLRSQQLVLEQRIHELDERSAKEGVTETEGSTSNSEADTYRAQRQRVINALDEADRADRSTWEQVKDGTRKAVKDVGDWIDRQAEKVDKGTSADADKDGH